LSLTKFPYGPHEAQDRARLDLLHFIVLSPAYRQDESGDGDEHSRRLGMNRTFVAVLMVGLAGVLANAQQGGGNATQASAAATPGDGELVGKPELLRRIALYEAGVQRETAEHAGKDKLAKTYMGLGGLYGDVAMYPKAEDAMRHGIALLRNGSQSDLAEAIGHLAVLHVGMGQFREAEKEELESLGIRESVGEPVGIAQTWNDLADVYVKQQHYKKAAFYGEKAMAVIGDDPKVDVADRIAIRQTLGYAFCLDKECERGLPLLKDAVEMSKGRYGEGSLEVGVAYYLLGYAAWQGGDMNGAADWMGRGINRMKVEMGWGHPVYLNAVSQYAQFLRKNGQMEAADSAQREVRQGQAVVDARSFTGRPASQP
jgi:tetratricopeptide (TPR) repeat protein